MLGGTYAHKNIAFKFANWISVEIELYITKKIPSTEDRGATVTRLVCETGTVVNQLPHTHRCHKAKPHFQVDYQQVIVTVAYGFHKVTDIAYRIAVFYIAIITLFLQ